ncbi:MAG: HAMP domain-containing sensor histidine kinase [Clostridium celatum]|uniref:sensor histidine kinase n=1 Tax=Clostridium celatum TaxID=36834 RepID=UPI001F170C52|nr:HAMP domain-containing sensor histidine kinase [Clostridium celatum]MCE9655204.1 HAMP domain-containing histidine kinase [Clostridium celatum]MDU3722780.1 HAMP domain-containing sensor histidine kinase [Clostridium celatum]
MWLDRVLFNTLKGKLLFGIISSIVLINLIFTVFVAGFLENTLKDDIILEMEKVKNFSLDSIKQGKVTEESLWKILTIIQGLSDSYVAIANKNMEIEVFVRDTLNEKEIKSILNESNNISSIIKFKRLNNNYYITYNYPVYLDGKFYGNLIIQKDYSDKYSINIKAIGIILLGQFIIVIIIISVVSILINKITKPIKVLKNSMEKFIESKDENDVLIKTNDEISELSKSYNLMKNKIKNQMNIIVEEKEKVEKLQKISREFFNNATHELKTPITSISLYAQILRDEDVKKLDEDFIYRATNRMVLESEKMKTLVEKILEVSKGEVKPNKNKVEFSITEIIGEIIEDFEVKIHNRKLTIDADLDEIRLIAVLNDIEQIISNLLDNSIKYSTSSSINIKLYKREENIIFEISNECGEFPEDIKYRLLEPFIKYNTYENIDKEVSSSGLGLYLCNELSRKNNGSLSYEIKNNKIKFTLKLLVE